MAANIAMVWRPEIFIVLVLASRAFRTTETMSTANESRAPPSALPPSTNAPPLALSTRKGNTRPVANLFPAKLYKMLNEVEALGLSAAVSWQPNGCAFAVRDKQLLMDKVVPRFFRATKIRSFERQLRLWGFHRIPWGRDARLFWHESFVRGRPECLKNITRTRINGKTSSPFHVPSFGIGSSTLRKKATRWNLEVPVTRSGLFVLGDEAGSISSMNQTARLIKHSPRCSGYFLPYHVSPHDTVRSSKKADPTFSMHGIDDGISHLSEIDDGISDLSDDDNDFVGDSSVPIDKMIHLPQP